MDRFNKFAATVGIAAAVLTCGAPQRLQAQGTPPGEEKGNEAPWYAAVGIGMIDYEGNEEVKDSLMTSFHIGYDYTEDWTFEGILYVAPSLSANDNFDYTLEDNPENGLHGSDTYSLGLAMDALFHFTRWDRLDPYLAAGAGVTAYGDELAGGNQADVAFRLGGGVMYHFNDEWAVRADYRAMLAGFGDTPNANSVINAGVCWYWGAHMPPNYMAADGPLDSDGDGLLDSEEKQIGTDPYDPDTDKDRLTDGQEVKQYKTDPLNPDTDLDLLKDGDEVLNYRTNPLNRDTDNGGVMDGHEVLEDGTDPLNGADDLMLFTLNIEFDTDKSIIRPMYFPDINIIGKVLKRNPETTTVIEGHADKRKTSSHSHNMQLSERRAQAVLDYLVEKGGINRSRMKAAGYGFTRPKAPNDPVNGNQVNRRVEIYIRGLGPEQKAAERKAIQESSEAKFLEVR